MTTEKTDTKILKMSIDSELLERVEEEAMRLDADIPTYVQWCIRTGLYLKDLNSFVRSKKAERK